MNPCIDFCYSRRREYSKECDVLCDYAKAVKEKNDLVDRALEIIDKEFGTTQPYCDAYGFIDFALKIKKIRTAILELKGGE